MCGSPVRGHSGAQLAPLCHQPSARVASRSHSTVKTSISTHCNNIPFEFLSNIADEVLVRIFYHNLLYITLFFILHFKLIYFY